MTTPEVTALLGFTVPPYEMLPETDARLTAEPGFLGDIFEQEGQLIITGGSAEVILGDTILNLVNELCFRALTDLDRDGEAVVELFATDEVVTLRRTRDRVALSGVFHPTVDLPAAPLIAALLEAGHRFLDLARRIWPNRGEPIGELESFAAEVRAQLATRD